MNNTKLALVLALILMVTCNISKALALDERQEEEYNRARILLTEEKTEEARTIFSMLAKEAPLDLKVRLGLIDTTIEEGRILKFNKLDGWKSKIYAAFGELKAIFRANATSPEIYLSFAKCYWLNNRFQKADKSLKKAFYYKPGYPEAYLLKGDMYFDKSKESNIDPFNESESQGESEQRRKIAIESYEKALIGITDSYTQSMVNYKLGELYAYFRNHNKGKDYFEKAVSIASNSYWAEKSKQKLVELK